MCHSPGPYLEKFIENGLEREDSPSGRLYPAGIFEGIVLYL